MATSALGFDRLEVNVDLAKQYIMENQDGIKSLMLDILKEPYAKKDVVHFKPKQREILAEKIKENSKLICQLEYLTCNIPMEDSEKNIQLILQYFSLSKKYKATSNTDPVAILKNTPLPLVIHAIEKGQLFVCDERSAVCHLLTKLFKETGVEFLMYHIPQKHALHHIALNNTPGGIGIVSERSDLDSAVDVFLSSSSSSACFWILRRIYVQENIYQSFRELIEFKAKLKGTKIRGYEELKCLSSDLFVYKEKVLLFDYAGDASSLILDATHVIFVEAYRTNKELLSLIGEKSSFGYVSLWSADVAEANEIAYSVPASLVWINDFGNFHGPPEISTLILNFSKQNSLDEPVPGRFTDSYETWKKYDSKKRASIIYDVLEKQVSSLSDEGKATRDKILKLQEQVLNLNFNTVDASKDKICVTLHSPVGFNCDDSFEIDADVLDSLVIGNGVVCKNLSGPTNTSLAVQLLRAGVPIWNRGDSSETDIYDKINVHDFRYRTKIVITNFGTIFAN